MPTLYSQHLNKAKYSTYVGIFYPWGEPISPHLLRYSASAVDDHVITSDRRKCGDLIIHRDQHEIATFATLFATESTATSTRE